MSDQRHLYGWLEMLRNRPGMYLPEVSMNALAAAIHGYRFALISRGWIGEETPRFVDFGDFVCARYSSSESATFWHRVIREQAASEEEAIALFFELLDDYRKETIEAKAAGTLKKEIVFCSFCNKSQRHVRKMIAGPEANICDECVDICLAVLNDEGEEPPNSPVAVTVGYAPAEQPALSATCVVCCATIPVALTLELGEHGHLCASCAGMIEVAIERKTTES